jgi:ribosomal protein L40E
MEFREQMVCLKCGSIYSERVSVCRVCGSGGILSARIVKK